MTVIIIIMNADNGMVDFATQLLKVDSVTVANHLIVQAKTVLDNILFLEYVGVFLSSIDTIVEGVYSCRSHPENMGIYPFSKHFI